MAWFAVLAVLFALPLLRAAFAPTPVLPPAIAAIAPFTLERANGSRFDSERLSGVVWLAAIVEAKTIDERLPALVAIERRCRFLASTFHVVLLSTEETALPLAEKLRALGTNPRRWTVLTARSGSDKKTWQTLTGSLMLQAGERQAALVDKHQLLRGTFSIAALAGAGQPAKNVAAFFRGGSAKISEDLVYAIGLLVNAP